VRAKLLSSASRIENHAVDFGSTHPTEQRARPNDGGIRHSDRSHRSCRRRRSDHARLKHLPSVQLHREPLIATTWAQRSVRRRTLRLPAEGVIVRTVGVSQGIDHRTVVRAAPGRRAPKGARLKCRALYEHCLVAAPALVLARCSTWSALGVSPAFMPRFWCCRLGAW
jgi:hypothetical protein